MFETNDDGDSTSSKNNNNSIFSYPCIGAMIDSTAKGVARMQQNKKQSRLSMYEL